MAPEAQASPLPSPHGSPPRHPEPDAPLAPMQQHAGDDVVVAAKPHAAAAKYVPPRGATHTVEPAHGRSWVTWSGGRTAEPPPRRSQPRSQQPPPQPRSQPPPQPQPQPQPPAVAPATARSDDRDHGVVPNILSRKRRAASLQRTALVARGAAAGLCLAALAVLAADQRKGWARDSYNRYSQLRYSEAVNVIGFVYSVFQFLALAELMRRNKHLIPRPKGDYFDFIMDQVLAYLLISSSSSATARVSDWIDHWGRDSFPNMANSSIVISFFAFFVFAISSLISAYNLFRRRL